MRRVWPSICGLILALAAGFAPAGPIHQVDKPRYFAASAGGGLVDGGLVTISGSGFDSNVPVANQEWQGGVDGVIETASNGAAWNTVYGSGWTRPGDHNQVIDNTHSLNGTKSLSSGALNQSTNWQFGSKFDTGTGGFTTALIRFSVYMTRVGGQSWQQLKMVRFAGGDGTTESGISDADVPNWYVTRFGANSMWAINEGTAATPDPFTNTIYISDAGHTVVGPWLDFDGWYTITVAALRPTSAGTTNGALYWQSVRESDGVVVAHGAATGQRMWDSATHPPRFLVLQGFFQDTWTNGAQWWYDRDIYFAWSSSGTTLPKFILLCNAATFATVTKCTLCPWEGTWSDTSITQVRVNKGQHANLTDDLWWYVMSAPGTAINSNGIAANSIWPMLLLGWRRRRAANDDSFYERRAA
jgi:hypothetical protein